MHRAYSFREKLRSSLLKNQDFSLNTNAIIVSAIQLIDSRDAMALIERVMKKKRKKKKVSFTMAKMGLLTWMVNGKITKVTVANFP